MRFVYKAKKGLDNIVEGIIDAQNREAALNKLLAQGVFPVSIEPDLSISMQQASGRKRKIARKFRSPVTSRQVFVFTQKLATLIKARVSLLYALWILYEQIENISFQEVILEIYNATKEGKTFSESLALFPRIFSPLYVNIIKCISKFSFFIVCS